MEISHGYYTNQTNVINPYNCLLLKIMSNGANFGWSEMGISTTGDYHGKNVLINLNLTGIIQTVLNPITFKLCNNDFALYTIANSKSTLYCKDFQYYCVFDKNNVITAVNVDGKIDVWGYMIVTELNIQ